jgi:hypothetical protein
MNASAIGPAVRAVGLALILAIAAAFGLAVGNALNGRANPDAGANIGGMVPGNAGGTPVSRTATSTFSMDALEAVQAARGDKAAATEDYVDYGLRHAAAEQATTTTNESLAKPTVR